ncbi:MAG: FtsH protease activity modulator HflK [Oligoflexales bacterium]
MSQKSGKSFEQVMEDLNNMISNIGEKKSSRGGNSGNGAHPPSKGGGGPSKFVQWLLIGAFAVIYGLFSSFYKVETTQKGVITRFGAFYDIADEGPHFKLPFGVDQVYKVEVTRIHEEQFGFRKQQNLSKQQARQESLMLTGDLKVAVVEWILQYKIDDAKKYLFNAVNVNKNIRDISVSVMRRVVGDKLVTDVLTTDRIIIAQQAKALTQETLDRFDMGVVITDLNLQRVNPPAEVRDAFNEVNIARQEKDKLINQAKGTYNKVIPEAEGKANQKVAEAEAYAINIVNHSKGDAEKFTEVLAAYKLAPAITRKRLFLEAMDDIYSKSDRLTIVDSQIKGLMPIFSSGQQKSLVSSLEQTTQENKKKQMANR